MTAARDRTGVPEGACVLVTGAAGFLGFHVARALLARGERVLGVDRSGGPEPALAAARLARLQAHDGFAFRRADIAEAGALEAAASGTEIGRAVHLAGHAGLRGADVPTLVRDNVRATAQVLAFCRARGIARLVHASSAAVYGGPGPAPAPVSAYGATKRRAEILARAAARAGGPQAVSLRYFTLYGPWSARASAARTFADAILDGRPVRLHGHGRMRRSFTFVEDAAAATLAALDGLPQPDANGTPWAAADVRHPAATGLEAFVDALEAALDGLPQPDANGTPWAAADVRHPAATGLEAFVDALEAALGRRARRERVPAARGEVMADAPDTGGRPVPCLEAPTGIEDGLARFAAWHLAVGRGPAGSPGVGASCGLGHDPIVQFRTCQWMNRFHGSTERLRRMRKARVRDRTFGEPPGPGIESIR